MAASTAQGCQPRGHLHRIRCFAPDGAADDRGAGRRICQCYDHGCRDRQRYWRLEAPPSERLQPRQETTIEALEIAARAARDQARLRHARALEDLRDGLLARLTVRDATRSEADAEAVLAALGQVMRPGPKVALRPEVTDAVIEALRGPFRLHVTYGSADAAPRVIEPHGLLLGHRSYLVARQPARGETILNFRMDRPAQSTGPWRVGLEQRDQQGAGARRRCNPWL